MWSMYKKQNRLFDIHNLLLYCVWRLNIIFVVIVVIVDHYRYIGQLLLLFVYFYFILY